MADNPIPNSKPFVKGDPRINRGGRPRTFDETVIEYEEAVKHAGGGTILFVCYGGGKAAEELSKQYGWIWYPDQQTQDGGG